MSVTKYVLNSHCKAEHCTFLLSYNSQDIQEVYIRCRGLTEEVKYFYGGRESEEGFIQEREFGLEFEGKVEVSAQSRRERREGRQDQFVQKCIEGDTFEKLLINLTK